MGKNISEKLDKYIDSYFKYKKANLINEKLANLARGKAPLKLSILKVKHLLKSKLIYFYIFSPLVLALTIFILMIDKESLNLKKSKILLSNDQLNKSGLESNNYSFIHLDSNKHKINQYSKVKESVNTTIFKNLKHENTLERLQKRNEIIDSSSSNSFISMYDFANYENDTIIINESLEDNEYKMLSNFKMFPDFELACKKNSLISDTVTNVNYKFRIYSLYNKLADFYPTSSKKKGTPAFQFIRRFERQDYIIFICCFHPRNKKSFFKFECSNGCISNIISTPPTDKFLLFGVKIKKADKNEKLQIRCVLENQSDESENTSGSTWSNWMEILN